IAGLVVVLSSVMLMNWNLYRDNKKFKILKRAKRIKKLRDMAPKSSIPRIVEISNFNSKHEKKNKKGERVGRSEEHTSELQSRENLVCRLLLEKKKYNEKLIQQIKITLKIIRA